MGLDENTGTSSHGDRGSSAAAGCAGASGEGCCADADVDNATVIRSADSRVTRCLICCGALFSNAGYSRRRRFMNARKPVGRRPRTSAIIGGAAKGVQATAANVMKSRELRTINGAFTNEGYACANSSRNWSSCSFERFVAMISNLMSFIRSETRSMTASLVIRKRADVPSVTALRTRLMKSSSMP